MDRRRRGSTDWHTKGMRFRQAGQQVKKTAFRCNPSKGIGIMLWFSMAGVLDCSRLQAQKLGSSTMQSMDRTDLYI